MSLDSDKSALRREMLKQRLTVDPSTRNATEKAMTSLFFSSSILQKTQSVAGYLPIRGEMDIGPILASIATEDNAVALPCIGADDTMTFRRWHPGEPLREGRYRIPEPVEGETLIPDLLLLPLLACDQKGVRLGAGGGYYDRTLSQPGYRNSYRIGVGFGFQLLPSLPSAPHDVKVHAFLSENGLQEFDGVE